MRCGFAVGAPERRRRFIIQPEIFFFAVGRLSESRRQISPDAFERIGRKLDLPRQRPRYGIEFSQNIVERNDRFDLAHADGRHFERKSGRQIFRQSVGRFVPNLKQPLKAIGRRSIEPGTDFVAFGRTEFGRDVGLRRGGDDGRVAQILEEIVCKKRQILPVMFDAPDACDGTGDIAVQNGFCHRRQSFARRNAQNFGGAFARNRRRRKSNDLIHRAERISHAAARRARNQPQRRRLEFDMLGLGNFRQMRKQIFVSDALKVVALATAQDCDGNFVRVGRRKDENHMRRRLFERLEQRIERLGREHVDFVDDINLVSIARRRIAHGLEDFADFVNPPVGRAVDLDDVHRTALGNFAAALACIAGLFARGMLAVERLGKDARRRRLSHAARPRKQKRMRHAVLHNRVLQRHRNVLLPHQIGKCLRAPLSGQNDIRRHKIPSSEPRARYMILPRQKMYFPARRISFFSRAFRRLFREILFFACVSPSHARLPEFFFFFACVSPPFSPSCLPAGRRLNTAPASAISPPRGLNTPSRPACLLAQIRQACCAIALPAFRQAAIRAACAAIGKADTPRRARLCSRFAASIRRAFFDILYILRPGIFYSSNGFVFGAILYPPNGAKGRFFDILSI